MSFQFVTKFKTWFKNKIQVVPREPGPSNISGRIMSDKLVLYEDDIIPNNYRTNLTNNDHYPEKIKLVKNSANYRKPSRRQSLAMQQPYSNPAPLREGEIVLVQEPGSRELRRMRLVSGPARHHNDIPYYDPPPVREQNRIVYYNTPREDPRSAYNGASNVDAQNMVYLYTPPKRSDRLMAYNVPYQAMESASRLHTYRERPPRDIRETQYIAIKGSSVDSGYRDLSIPSASSRRSCSSRIMERSTQLEVETLERFRDPNGKTYKVVKPVGERTRYIYKKPEDYEKLLIVEGSSVEPSRSVSRNTLTPEPAIESSPDHHEELDTTSESTPVPLPELTPEPKPEPEPQPDPIEAKKSATTSTQTIPKE